MLSSQHPHMPPLAAASALGLCPDAWLLCPQAARPDLNTVDTTPILTEYNLVGKLTDR